MSEIFDNKTMAHKWYIRFHLYGPSQWGGFLNLATRSGGFILPGLSVMRLTVYKRKAERRW